MTPPRGGHAVQYCPLVSNTVHAQMSCSSFTGKGRADSSSCQCVTLTSSCLVLSAAPPSQLHTWVSVGQWCGCSTETGPLSLPPHPALHPTTIHTSFQESRCLWRVTAGNNEHYFLSNPMDLVNIKSWLGWEVIHIAKSQCHLLSDVLTREVDALCCFRTFQLGPQTWSPG